MDHNIAACTKNHMNFAKSIPTLLHLFDPIGEKQPQVYKARTVPFALKERREKELEYKISASSDRD